MKKDVIKKVCKDILTDTPSFESLIDHVIKNSEDISKNLVFEARINGTNYDVWQESDKYKIIKSSVKGKNDFVKTMSKQEFKDFFVKEIQTVF